MGAGAADQRGLKQLVRSASRKLDIVLCVGIKLENTFYILCQYVDCDQAVFEINDTISYEFK